MKRRTLVAVAALAVAFLPVSAPRAQQGYPLFCRGPISRTIFSNGSMMIVNLTFARGTVGAGQNGIALSPGSCAWSDRPLSGSEPDKMQYSAALNRSGANASANFEAAVDAHIAQCLSQSQCVTQFNGVSRPEGGQQLVTVGGPVGIIYPK